MQGNISHYQQQNQQHSPPIFFNPSSDFGSLISGGLFLEPTVPDSFVRLLRNYPESNPQRRTRSSGGVFLSVSLPNEEGKRFPEHKSYIVEKQQRKVHNVKRVRGGSAVNTTKHLWAGAIAAMVSRTCVAPLERLKLEYIVRGEKRNILELIKTIAITQGLRGFWKGNLVNVLRTAPFKAVNFYAYDTYRKQLLRFSGNEETTNFERFIAGAAAGITATSICLPLDTIRTKLVAPGGEALGGVIGAFQYMVRTEGIFSLYKGLVPSIISMAPSGAVFYGVYDILKSAYLHSPEGMKRIENLHKQGQELSAFDQLELGPVRTLLYGAIAGACAEAATYPFEVLRRQLQLQVRSTKLSTLATCVKIVEHGGIPALYAGLIPSLLQVLPSASISYFVYECMKIVLKVE
ncbi:PREDICTED: probable mitochondrial adenine nucleotide transporter BTL3 [Lupinus angustifolius]|uniref:probable mitochondrial adenine nucleotide transporter BTL3 n=1 Tax=Lupinus angustifolius TaxID=3871 RepID=UPI00092FA9B3|nr:PREDICTED: probable mitochondrial adenine nucleotide transporter BTL3 [Lupinus angustifolius]